MATKTSQRVGIWVIAFVMLFGTLGAFFLPILMNDNAAREADELQALQEQYEKQMNATTEPLDGYAAEPFDKAAVTDLKVEVLKEGDGEKVATPESKVTANYFGWTSDGKIFDSSKKDGVSQPIPFGLNEVIKGWTEGLTGAKAGGVYKLMIPADKAYGDVDTGSGRPVGPLAFIVEVKGVE
jgi:FKBP-type peptidyl-prolyl cis-trans isomerase